MTEEQAANIVCDWSMEFGVAMTEEALDALIKRIILETKPVLQ